MIDRLAIYLFCEQLRAEVVPSDGTLPETVRGLDTFACTNTAKIIAEQFGGVVYGYFTEETASKIIGSQSGGHDFCFIDDRFLVDWWAWEFEGLTITPVRDMHNLEDRLYVKQFYMPKENWNEVFNFSNLKPQL